MVSVFMSCDRGALDRIAAERPSRPVNASAPRAPADMGRPAIGTRSTRVEQVGERTEQAHTHTPLHRRCEYNTGERSCELGQGRGLVPLSNLGDEVVAAQFVGADYERSFEVRLIRGLGVRKNLC